MKNLIMGIVAGCILLLNLSAYAQESNTDEVRLFQSYFYDVPVVKSPVVEGGLAYDKYAAANTFNIGALGQYPINPMLEVGAALAFSSVSPDVGDGQSGITDLYLYGHYLLAEKAQTKFSVGGTISLPIGSEDIGQGNLNFGGFGAIRHTLPSGLTLAGNIGLILLETKKFEYNASTFKLEEKSSHDASLQLGFGGIYPVDQSVNLVGEFLLASEGDYTALSFGVDYGMTSGKLRAMLALGLDDGAPDFSLAGSYSIALNRQ